MSPTRFPGGLTTAKKTDPLGDFILPDMTTAHVYYEDFDYYRAADWDIAILGAASGALTDLDGGALELLTTAASGDIIQIKKPGEFFRFEPGKKLWFETLVKVDGVDDTSSVFGLRDFSSTVKVNFEKTVGNEVNVHIQNAFGTTEISLGPIIMNGTFIRLSYFYNGKDKLTAFVDGAAVMDTTDLTHLPLTEDLTIFFNFSNIAATSNSLTVDYFVAAKER